MRITSVETIRLAFPARNGHADAQHRFDQSAGLAIRLHSESGLTGHGYVGLGASCHTALALKALVDHQLAPVLVDADPFLPRQIRDRMCHELEYVGIQGISHLALTCIDGALWDLMARALGVPGWKLLGACRDRISAYAMVGWYYDNDENLEQFRRAIATALEDEMAGIKVKVGRGSLNDDVRRIEVARQLIGRDGVLMVDANQVLTRNEALRRGRVYEELGATWFEEPLRPHDKEGYGWLCENLDLPVAAGENEYTKYAVQELIAARGCDILQPDARRTGGPSEWMEIAGLAAAHHVPIASHGGSGVTSHLLMATPTAVWCETGGKPKGPGIYKDHARIDAGWVYAPEAVGFGTELRREVLEEHGVKE